MNHHFLSRPALLHTIDKIKLKPKKKLSALFVGDNESQKRGAGIQFSDFRPYEWGDDIRHISWTATAKTGKPIIKSYEEEKELNLCLVVDVSGSSLFGSSHKRKLDMYSEVAAVLGMAAIKHGFRVSTILFDQEVKHFSPPSRKKEEFLRLIQELPDLNLFEQKSALKPALSLIDQSLRQKSLIIILSDFLMADFDRELLKVSQKHDVILMRGYDDAEQAITSRGVFEICDPETGSFFLFDTESEKSRFALHEFYSSFSEKLKQIAINCNADLLPLSVQDDYLQRLVVFFDHR